MALLPMATRAPPIAVREGGRQVGARTGSKVHESAGEVYLTSNELMRDGNADVVGHIPTVGDVAGLQFRLTFDLRQPDTPGIERREHCDRPELRRRPRPPSM